MNDFFEGPPAHDTAGATDNDEQTSVIPPTLLRNSITEEFTLRLATPDEYDTIGDALFAAFHDGCWVTEHYGAGLKQVSQMAASAHVWGIFDSSNVVQAAVLTPKPDDYHETNYTFNKLGVAPWGRGHGFGRILVNHSLALARAYGYRTVELHSSPQMTAAHRLYYSCGFHRRSDWETIIVDQGQRLLTFTHTDYDR